MRTTRGPTRSPSRSPDAAPTAAGRVLGRDIDGDLAVIGVETGDLPTIEWATNGQPGIGAAAFALRIRVERGLRVTLGFVTGVEREFPRGPRAPPQSPEASSTTPRCFPAHREAQSSTPMVSSWG